MDPKISGLLELARNCSKFCDEVTTNKPLLEATSFGTELFSEETRKKYIKKNVEQIL